MKKTVFISFVISFLFCSFTFSQTKNIHKENFKNTDFSICFESNNIDFFWGHRNYRELYFDYKPKKGTWRLKKDIRKKNLGFGLGFERNVKVIARFENPSGGRDFIIRINRNGFWRYNGPSKWFKILKKKLIKNL